MELGPPDERQVGELPRVVEQHLVKELCSAAAALFNAVALGSLRGAPATPGTCQGQLHFGRSDTLVGRKTVAGAKHRGPRWTEHVRRLRPDLAVVSAGSHLSGPEQLSGNVDANKPTPPRL